MIRRECIAVFDAKRSSWSDYTCFMGIRSHTNRSSINSSDQVEWSHILVPEKIFVYRARKTLAYALYIRRLLESRRNVYGKYVPAALSEKLPCDSPACWVVVVISVIWSIRRLAIWGQFLGRNENKRSTPHFSYKSADPVNMLCIFFTGSKWFFCLLPPSWRQKKGVYSQMAKPLLFFFEIRWVHPQRQADVKERTPMVPGEFTVYR